jgi:hypothetical protein
MASAEKTKVSPQAYEPDQFQECGTVYFKILGSLAKMDSTIPYGTPNQEEVSCLYIGFQSLRDPDGQQSHWKITSWLGLS